MDVEPVLRTAQRSQGVVTWGQLLSEHPRRRIEAAVDAGLLVRVGRGKLSLPSTPDPLRQALVHRGVVSHAAAARLWFLETLHDPVTTDVTVPPRCHLATGGQPGPGCTGPTSGRTRSGVG